MVDPTEVRVPDIKPFGFIIEILDNEQEPVARVTFSVAVDDGNAETMETDESGILKVPKPTSEINLSLVGKEYSKSSE